MLTGFVPIWPVICLTICTMYGHNIWSALSFTKSESMPGSGLGSPSTALNNPTSSTDSINGWSSGVSILRSICNLSGKCSLCSLTWVMMPNCSGSGSSGILWNWSDVKKALSNRKGNRVSCVMSSVRTTSWRSDLQTADARIHHWLVWRTALRTLDHPGSAWAPAAIRRELSYTP
jgi:hypothetical protein